MSKLEEVPKEFPEEVEVKLRLSAGSREALERHPAFSIPRASLPETRSEVTTYFDTRVGALSGSGTSLRVRRSGDGGFVQTLKMGAVAEGAAARRGEWEWPVGGAAPDLGLLAGVAGAEAITALDGALVTVCTTEISRTVRRIADEDSSVIEAVIDDGRIRAGKRSVPVSELELELKSGSTGALYRLARELAHAVPLCIEPASKAERGARLSGLPGRTAVKPADVALDRSMTGVDAFRAIIGAGVGHMRLNLEPAARGQAEGVHQVRVASRRLRAAIALFKPLLAREPAARFNAALRRSGRVFGAARDWDVFATEILPEARAGGVEQAWLDLLAERAAPVRVAAHVETARELASPEFTALLLDLSAWAEDGTRNPAELGDLRLGRSLEKCLPDLLDRLLHRTGKRAAHLKKAGAPELHSLRKAMKTLRYGVEFAGPLYRPKAVKAFLKPCRQLQELLGTLNDAAGTPERAAQLAEPALSDFAPAKAAFGAWAEQRGASARTAVPKAWHALRDADRFWE